MNGVVSPRLAEVPRNHNHFPDTNGQLPTPTDSPPPEDVLVLPTTSDEQKTPSQRRPVADVMRDGGVAKTDQDGDRLHLSANGSAEMDIHPHDEQPQNAKRVRVRGKVASPPFSPSRERVLKLSPTQISELTSSPTSLPFRSASPLPEELSSLVESRTGPENERTPDDVKHEPSRDSPADRRPIRHGDNKSTTVDTPVNKKDTKEQTGPKAMSVGTKPRRPSISQRAASGPPTIKRKASSATKAQVTAQDNTSQTKAGRPKPGPLNLKDSKLDSLNGSNLKAVSRSENIKSPMAINLPLPPVSIPTYLQLEISSEKPSQLYINRPSAADLPYESSTIKFERLLNFLKLPPQLERLLTFGALVCLDAWLYTFTILPLRFLIALSILVQWWLFNAWKEVVDLGSFVYQGLGRVWRRRRKSSMSTLSTPTASRRTSQSSIAASKTDDVFAPNGKRSNSFTKQQKNHMNRALFKHRGTKSTPSTLKTSHKADLLQGFLIIGTCMVLMQLDPSRMYHSVRGQAAIKLYVIYNVLEVGDRLFSAFGQDVIECLLSGEVLERGPDGRSKVLRPIWMFLLALAYTVVHSTTLFCQVLTLNVAVNSYSNALLTLLMSNQFVEIKGTVFKRFEKENLFQLTCADVVERFQLWLMLLIIGMRNIVELGGISLSNGVTASTTTTAGNATHTPLYTASILPQAFDIVPRMAGQLIVPFLIVIGSEMVVDGIKHAYIGKFNGLTPKVYSRYLDVMAKDYYSHAFVDQNLTKRLGLPVIPLACLFIRACLQTYHMFLATHMPLPIPSSATELAIDSDIPSSTPATTAAIAHIDQIFRRALGRSTFGAGASEPASTFSWRAFDDVIAFATMIVVFAIAYLLLLAFKLILGMCLLSFSRRRYRGMSEREKKSGFDVPGKRGGIWGVTELEDEKKRDIYGDDDDGYKAMKERERKYKLKAENSEGAEYEELERYRMVSKRIW